MLLVLVFFAHILQAALSSPSKNPVPTIRTLFAAPEGRHLVYPPIDVTGPKPRSVWVEAYHRAKLAGLIPTIPKTTISGGFASYPASYHGEPCNFGRTMCNASSDITTAPAGMVGISFDDGPQPDSMELLAYLKSQSQKATHFLIGSRILSNMAIFNALDQAGEHHAVHTYTHPMMTSLTDEEILGEIGWTMQVIYDNSRGKVLCRYWRSPYGDVDNRVRAIAQHVFGLTTVTWRFDPRDWCLSDLVPNGSACGHGNGPQNINDLKHSLDTFAHSSKKEGLMVLEHEHTHRAVQGFKNIFPIMKKLGWKPRPIPNLFHQAWYQA